MVRSPNLVLTPLKSASKSGLHLLFALPKSSFGRDKSPFRTFYAPQTKILEGGTKDEIRIFEALFKGVSTRFGLQNVEKCFENAFGKVRPTFQNLRLGTIQLSCYYLVMSTLTRQTTHLHYHNEMSTNARPF